MNKFTEEQKIAFVAEYAAGATAKELSVKYGFHETSLYNWIDDPVLNPTGMKKKAANVPQKAPSRFVRVSEEEAQQIAEDWRNDRAVYDLHPHVPREQIKYICKNIKKPDFRYNRKKLEREYSEQLRAADERRKSERKEAAEVIVNTEETDTKKTPKEVLNILSSFEALLDEFEAADKLPNKSNLYNTVRKFVKDKKRTMEYIDRMFGG